MTARFTVIKIGGSLLETGHLAAMLRRIAGMRGRRIAVVPGGGVFADAVRQAQSLCGFDDALAHRLALAAMGQMAEICAALDPIFRRADEPAGFDKDIEDGRIPIWDPSRLKYEAAIPQSWTVTSDSLAVWLGIHLDAARVVLVKSIDPEPETRVVDLAGLGIVDDALPSFAARFRGAIEVVGPARWDLVSASEGVEG